MAIIAGIFIGYYILKLISIFKKIIVNIFFLDKAISNIVSLLNSAVEQRPACQIHTLEVTGSNPVRATT